MTAVPVFYGDPPLPLFIDNGSGVLVPALSVDPCDCCEEDPCEVECANPPEIVLYQACSIDFPCGPDPPLELTLDTEFSFPCCNRWSNQGQCFLRACYDPIEDETVIVYDAQGLGGTCSNYQATFPGNKCNAPYGEIPKVGDPDDWLEITAA